MAAEGVHGASIAVYHLHSTWSSQVLHQLGGRARGRRAAFSIYLAFGFGIGSLRRRLFPGPNLLSELAAPSRSFARRQRLGARNAILPAIRVRVEIMDAKMAGG